MFPFVIKIRQFNSYSPNYIEQCKGSMSGKRLLLFIMEDSKVYYCLSHNVDALRCRSQCFNCLLLVSSGNEVYVNNVTTSDKASGNEVSDRYVLFSLQDGHELPPPIGFDLPSGESLPSSKAMHCCDYCVRNSTSKYRISSI